MKRSVQIGVCVLVLALLACSGVTAVSTPTVTAPSTSAAATSTPLITPTRPETVATAPPQGAASDTPGPAYGWAFGIDYAHPAHYLAQGEQSQISDPTVLDGLRAEEQSLNHLGDVYRWLKSTFATYAAGGKTIGVVTVDQLLVERRLGGCHDHALVYAAVVRGLGYPAVMVRTDSIAWVERFQAGEPNPHVGHVFVEVYLDGRWVLIDSTGGWYVAHGYDPANPVIPLRGTIAGSSEEVYGFYVERKGIDIWDFGIHSPEESTQAMDELARQLNLEGIVYPDYDFLRFSSD